MNNGFFEFTNIWVVKGFRILAMRYKSVLFFASGTLISRVLGLVREAGIAYLLGASRFSDVFYVAFRIPNYLRDLIAENAIQTAFVPVFVRELKSKESSQRLFSTVFFAVVGVGALAALIGVLFSPVWVTISAYGFKSIPEKFNLTVNLVRLMFPFLALIAISALFMGVLNSFRVFFIPAVAPAFFNMAIISAIGLAVYFSVGPVPALYIVAAGVLIGGLAQALIQLPSLKRKGMKIAKPDFSHPGLMKIRRLFIPVILSTALTRFTLFVNTLIASFLMEGSISYLNYAFRLMHLPIALFGVGVSTVTLPEVARSVTEEDKLRLEFWASIRGALFFTVPITVFFILKADSLISVLYMRGAFRQLDVVLTAQALIFYSLNIVPFALSRVLLNLHFAKHEIKMPNIAFSIGALVNLIVAITLSPVLSFPALALATSCGGISQMIFLTAIIPKSLRIDKYDLVWVTKLVFATLISGAVLLKNFPSPLTDLVISGLAYLSVFGLIASIMGIPEVKGLIHRLRG